MSNIIKNQQRFKGLLVGFFLILTFILPINSIFNFNIMEVKGQQQQSQPQQITNTNQTSNANVSSTTNSSSIFRFPTLLVVTNMQNDSNPANNNDINASSFSQVVTNEYQTSDGFADAYHFTTGSEVGINMNLRPGTYIVGDLGDNTTLLLNQLYNTTYSGDCVGVSSINNTVIGYGVINVNDAQICNITKSPL